MVPPLAALARTHDVDDDPIWAAALAAPPCSEDALSPEERAQIEAAIEDVRAGRVELVPHEDVHAELERSRRVKRG